MGLKLLLVFAITEFLLSLTPGPAVLLVVSQAVRVGFRSSITGVIGILTGNAFYFVLSALGLAALLSTSVVLFQVVRWLGAGYLIFVGIRMLISKEQAREGQIVTSRTRQSLALFSQGLVTQLSNPKALVFFTALLPQFVSPGGKILAQFVCLGLISIAVEFPVLAVYGLLADKGSNVMPQRWTTLPQRIGGGFLIAAGIGLVSMRSR
jgi:threonine/homoserine/homoserine lactone efflux protein